MNRRVAVLRFVSMLAQIAALAGLAAVATYVTVFIGFVFFLPDPKRHVYDIQPSPDRTVGLVTEATVGSLPTSDVAYDVYLLGGAFSPQVELGTYFHGGPAAGDGWRDAGRVNICMLRYPFEKPADAEDKLVQVTTARGQVAQVRLTKECPPRVLQSWKWRWG